MPHQRGDLVLVPDKPITIGHYTLTPTGLIIKGRPSFDEHLGVGAFIGRAHHRSGWWLADYLRYTDTRADWQPRIDEAIEVTGLALRTLENVRAIGAIDHSRRRENVDFSTHGEVVSLEPNEQDEVLEAAEANKWGKRETRLEVRARKKRRIITGQAVLVGKFPVVYCDFPWIYGDRPPSGSGAQQHYPGMTFKQGRELPIEAHVTRNAVLFFWVTAPMLYEVDDLGGCGPFNLIRAWGFTPKTGRVWDKVRHGFGHYVEVRHEHLIIATRGSCTPDRPTPMLPSVVTERSSGVHSEKPESFRTDIERLYDGPYLELFGRKKVEGWTVFGNDAKLWAEQAEGAA